MLRSLLLQYFILCPTHFHNYPLFYLSPCDPPPLHSHPYECPYLSLIQALDTFGMLHIRFLAISTAFIQPLYSAPRVIRRVVLLYASRSSAVCLSLCCLVIPPLPPRHVSCTPASCIMLCCLLMPPLPPRFVSCTPASCLMLCCLRMSHLLLRFASCSFWIALRIQLRPAFFLCCLLVIVIIDVLLRWASCHVLLALCPMAFCWKSSHKKVQCPPHSAFVFHNLDLGCTCVISAIAQTVAFTGNFCSLLNNTLPCILIRRSR